MRGDAAGDGVGRAGVLEPPPLWAALLSARVLWVLMPWATREAGELMTAAALPSAPCMMRLLR